MPPLLSRPAASNAPQYQALRTKAESWGGRSGGESARAVFAATSAPSARWPTSSGRLTTSWSSGSTATNAAASA